MVLAASVRAAADLDVSRRNHVHQVRARAQELSQRAAKTTRLCDRKTAALRTGAAHDVAKRSRIRRSEPGGGETLIERLDRGGFHPSKQHVLIDGEPHRSVAVGLGQIRQHTHLAGSEIAKRQTNRDVAIARLLLLADVAAHPAHVAVGQRRQSHRAGQDARAVDRCARCRCDGLQRRRKRRCPIGRCF